MIRIVAYILNFFAPIIDILGVIGLFSCVITGDFLILIFAGILWLVGLIFGISAYKEDIPPRWTWSKSANELFKFSITAVLGYAGNFAMWPCAFYTILVIIDGRFLDIMEVAL